MGGVKDRQYGVGRGRVFPASRAKSLVNPLRRLLQSPARTVAATGVRAGSTVLEVGSGPGYFSPDLAGAAAPGVFVGVDLQVEMLRLARARLARSGVSGGSPSGALVNGDAMALPFASATFDFVLVATVLGEVPDRGRCLAELRRVLRLGGVASFCETRRDSDFVPLGRLRTEVEACGFRFRERRGPAWQYVANFAAV